MNRVFPAVLMLGIHLLFLGVGVCRVGGATLEIRPGPDSEFIQLDSWTEAGRLYLLQSRPDLRSPMWTDLESIVGTGGAERRFRPVDGSAAGFYRLREIAPWGGPIILTTRDAPPQFTRQGSWRISSLAGQDGRSSLYSVDWDGVCAWRPTSIPPGRYRVYAFFPRHLDNVRQADYTIVSEAGVEVATINQAIDGGRWIQLGGVHSFRPERCLVQLVRGGGSLGSLRADAVMFEPVLSGEEVLVSAQAGSREWSAVGEWNSEEAGAGQEGVTFWSDSPEAVCQWRPGAISYGTYKVEVYVPAGVGRLGLADYTIGSLSGVETVRLDQTAQAGRWVSIGGVHRFAGAYCYVQLRAVDGGGPVSAQAIRFVPSEDRESADFLGGSSVSFALEAVRPTVFFKNTDPLRQVALATIVHRGPPEHYRFTVKAGGREVARHDVGPVFGLTEVPVDVPDVSEPTLFECGLQSLSEPARVAERSVVWLPQKKWKIYLVETAHSDLGYEDYVRLKHFYLMDWADEGLGMADRTAQSQYRLGYHFFFEHLWWFLNYEKVKGPERMDELLVRVRDGRASLGGVPTLGHGAWMGGEEAVRFTYPMMQEVRNRYGLMQPAVAYYADTDLPSWGSAQALAESGYRGLVVAPNDWRLGSSFQARLLANGMSPLFYWEMPNGKDRLLTYIDGGYGQGLSLHYSYSLARQHYQTQLVAWLSGLENSGYRYDAVLSAHYLDNERPNLDVQPFVEAWNREFRYPEILHNAPMAWFLDHIATNYSDVPIYSGELNSPWADYAAIDVTSHGAKREAAALAATGETLATLANFCDGDYAYPFVELRELYEKFNEYNEHSWPTLPTARDFNVVNTKYFKTQSAREFLRPKAEAITQQALQSLLAQVGTTGKSVVVFNPLLRLRSGYVEVPTGSLGSGHFQIRNLLTGALVPHQALAGGRTLLFAENVPALGYLTLRVEARADPPQFSSPLLAGGGMLSNRFYVVRLDATTGGIESLVDRELGVELVQPGQVLNAYIYRYNYQGQSPAGTNYSPTQATLAVEESGPLRAVLRATTREPQSGADIIQRVILYHESKRVDIVNELTGVDKMYEPFSGAPSQNADVRYRHNIFYEFPFAVPEFQVHAALATGVVLDFANSNAALWTLLSNKDYLCVDNWARLSGRNYGVTFVSPDAPILQFGEIRYNQRSTLYQPTNSSLYSHVQSSRLGPHNFLQPEDCNHRVRYSIHSGRGTWAEAGAPALGRGTDVGLLAGVIPSAQPGRRFEAPAASFLSVKPGNIELSVLKQSEAPGHGLVIRLRETEGRAVTGGVLYFNLFTPAAAYATDIAEVGEAGTPLPVQGNTIRFNIGKFDWTTIRIRTHVGVPSVTGLVAGEVGDASATLQWNGPSGAHGYNVYRSTRRDFRPHAYNRVACTGQPAYTDRGLDLGTTYFYQVTALNTSNEEGPPSEIEITTASENRTPPQPVSGFMAMTMPSQDQIPRVVLHWVRSPDSDRVYYSLHRSTVPDFVPDPANLVAAVGDIRTYYQAWFDSWNLQPNTTYYYKLISVDAAENAQPLSPVAKVTTLAR